jgi:hypothetical protein
MAHHDNSVRKPDDFYENIALEGGGVLKDCMEGCHDRRPQLPEKREDKASRFSPEDSVFVLQ